MRTPPAAHRSHPRAGFTLVEILASLLFLAIAVPAIVGALGVASRASEVAERSSVAGNLAENKLNELLVGDAWQNAAQPAGDCGGDFLNYRWQMATQAWAGNTADTGTTSASAAGANTLTELSVEVFYPVQGSERSVRLTTLVGTASTTTTPTTTGSPSAR